MGRWSLANGDRRKSKFPRGDEGVRSKLTKEANTERRWIPCGSTVVLAVTQLQGLMDAMVRKLKLHETLTCLET